LINVGDLDHFVQQSVVGGQIDLTVSGKNTAYQLARESLVSTTTSGYLRTETPQQALEEEAVIQSFSRHTA
jgi:hypothetical protein